MGSEATVLFSVGATKAGTSWLYRYLRSHPDCHLRGVKELHYFDAVDRDDRTWQAGRFRRRQRENTELGDPQGRVAAYRELASLLENPAEDTPGYLSYLNRGRSSETVVADVTPSYSLLSADRYRMMGKIVADVRFIYILRDPVARLWSHIRMKAAHRSGDTGSVQDWANRIFWRMERGRNPGILKRGDYRTVLKNLRAAVIPSRLLVLFYEDLFSAETTRRICDFLGIGQHPAAYAKPVYAGPAATMNDDQRRIARGWLADQYDYVAAHFDNVPATWQMNKVRVQA